MKNKPAAVGTCSPVALLAAAELVDAGTDDVADTELLEPVPVIVLEAAAEDVAACAELTIGNVPEVA